jgi:hypothetical protein
MSFQLVDKLSFDDNCRGRDKSSARFDINEREQGQALLLQFFVSALNISEHLGQPHWTKR